MNSGGTGTATTGGGNEATESRSGNAAADPGANERTAEALARCPSPALQC